MHSRVLFPRDELADRLSAMPKQHIRCLVVLLCCVPNRHVPDLHLRQPKLLCSAWVHNVLCQRRLLQGPRHPDVLPLPQKYFFRYRGSADRLSLVHQWRCSAVDAVPVQRRVLFRRFAAKMRHVPALLVLLFGRHAAADALPPQHLHPQSFDKQHQRLVVRLRARILLL